MSVGSIDIQNQSSEVNCMFRLFMPEIKDFECREFGSGHIHDTFFVRTAEENFVMQRVNPNVFPNIPEITENMLRVAAHLKAKDVFEHVLELMPCSEGQYYRRGEDGAPWRLFRHVPNSAALEQVETVEQAFLAASGFGLFQKELADFEGEPLKTILADFHNTPERYRHFNEARHHAEAGRLDKATEAIDFVLSWIPKLSLLEDLAKSGEVPLRCVHHDAKLNNLLLDESGEKMLCVIDLDLVMPGLSLYDFGDLMRTSICAAAEDEEDLDLVKLRRPFFQAICRGYLQHARHFLTQKEIDLLPQAGAVITFTIAIRFLTDYLNGDKYFKVHKSDHNLKRAISQFALVKDIEANLPELQRDVRDIMQEFEK